MTQTMTPLMELEKVTKIFGRKTNITVALDDMSLAVPEDFPYIITIAGESGSGKTTLGLLLLGFYVPTSGRVLHQGKDISTLTRQEIFAFRKEVQAVFQAEVCSQYARDVIGGWQIGVRVRAGGQNTVHHDGITTDLADEIGDLGGGGDDHRFLFFG